MDPMLKALREFSTGPLSELIRKLGGKDGSWWEQELVKFLRKKPGRISTSFTKPTHPKQVLSIHTTAAPIKKPKLRTAPSLSTEKFVLLADLGILTVPTDYDSSNQLKTFRKKHSKKFLFFADEITDENFSNQSYILKSGDTLHVKVYKQSDPNLMTSEELVAHSLAKDGKDNTSGAATTEDFMSFLEAQGAKYTGPQGASLVFEHKRRQLPKDYWYASFDRREHLWKNDQGAHRLPGLVTFNDGLYNFSLNNLDCDDGWPADYAMFCMTIIN